MKIFSPAMNYLKTSAVNRNFLPVFRGNSKLSKDTFEKISSPKTRQVTVKNLDGEPVEVTIAREELPEDRFMCSKGSRPVEYKMNLCMKSGTNYYASGYNSREDNSLHLEHLFTDENYIRQYKGAGTELLKCMVEESKKRGFQGRMSTSASNFPPPFVFYYKNNFKVAGGNSFYNASIDYAIRHNIPVTKVIDKNTSCLHMELDSNGAEDFLQGKREYKDRSFETIDRTEIKGHDIETNLIEAPDGLEEEYYVQIIDNSCDELKQKYVACVRGGVDENGQKCLEVFKINDMYASPKIEEYAEEMLQKTALDLGFEKYVITKRRHFG